MANILVDVDDTIAQTQKHNLAYIKNTHGKTYKFAEMTKHFREGKDPEYDRLITMFLENEQLVSEVQPYNLALENLKKLHQADNKIHIASARKENLHKVTENWLITHGFIDYVHHIHPRPNYQKSVKFKVETAKENNIDVAFDDTWDIAEALAGVGVTVYLIHKPWNKDEVLPKNIIRVDDFAKGVDLFLSIV